MSQVRDKRQNNVRAGIFVLFSLILAFVVFSFLTNAWGRIFSTVSNYQVVFSVQDGVGSLSTGSRVTLGGVLVGKVQQVKPRVEGDSPTSLIDVFFTLDNQYDLYENASIQARAGLLGSTAWLSITNVGDDVKATSNSKLIGSTQTMVGQLLGQDAEINITKILDSLRMLSEALSEDGGALNVLLGSSEAEGFKMAIDSARTSLLSIKSVMGSTEIVWPEWETSISTILTDSKPIPNQIRETLSLVNETVQDVRVNILTKVERSMQSFENTMNSLENISKTYQEKSPTWAAEISSIIGNVNRVSARAKSAIDEIASSPWRLIYRPKDREIAYEHLNAASWQLQQALEDLRISAEALEIASKAPNAPADSSSLASSLSKSAAEFEQAREAIEHRMQIEFPNRK
jgi:hypothetical protein